MKKIRNVLLLGGSFSGATTSLMSGLQARGCRVHHERPSLRRLALGPLYGELRGDALKQRFYEAQIFAMPSLREPFGLVFLEAAWAKTVSIGTNLGAIPEIIADGETGYVVEPNDSDALSERIITLLDRPELRASFAERAYADAKQRWSWDVVLSKMLREANRLLQ